MDTAELPYTPRKVNVPMFCVPRMGDTTPSGEILAIIVHMSRAKGGWVAPTIPEMRDYLQQAMNQNETIVEEWRRYKIARAKHWSAAAAYWFFAIITAGIITFVRKKPIFTMPRPKEEIRNSCTSFWGTEFVFNKGLAELAGVGLLDSSQASEEGYARFAITPQALDFLMDMGYVETPVMLH